MTKEEIEDAREQWEKEGRPDGEGHQTEPKQDERTDTDYQSHRYYLNLILIAVAGAVVTYIAIVTAPIWVPALLTFLFASPSYAGMAAAVLMVGYSQTGT